MSATVPMSIIKQFNIQAGDKLSWKLTIDNGELAIIVRPVKGKKYGDQTNVRIE